MVAAVMPSIAAPARSLQPGPRSPESSGSKVRPWPSGAICGDRRLGLVRGGEVGEPAQPGDDAAAVGQRAPEQDPLRVDAVAPQRGRRERAAPRARRRGARRSCRSSAPRGPASRSRRRGSRYRRRPRPGTTGRPPAPATARPSRRSGRCAGRRRSAAACPRRPARRPARRSHAQAAWSSRPVPEAIETLAAASPRSRRWTYSPGETQVRTRSNVSGCVSRSHASFAGQ